MSDFEDAILKSGGLPNAAPAVVAQRMFEQVSKGEISEYTFGMLQKNLAEAMGLSLSEFFDHPVGKITLANRPLHGYAKQYDLMKREGHLPAPSTDAQAAHEATAHRTARNEDFVPRHSDARHDINGESDPPETAPEEESYDSQKNFDARVQAYIKDNGMKPDRRLDVDRAVAAVYASDKARKAGESTKFRNMRR